MKREIFTKQKLSNGDEVTIYQMLGIDMFNASQNSDSNSGVMIFYLMCEAITKDGKQITLDYVKRLPICDTNLLIETMAAQLGNLPKV